MITERSISTTLDFLIWTMIYIVIIFIFISDRYEAKTCDDCTEKIVEEKFISTSNGKYFHQDCYSSKTIQ